MSRLCVALLIVAATTATAQDVRWALDIEGFPAGTSDYGVINELVSGPAGLYGLGNTSGRGLYRYSLADDEWVTITYPEEGYSPVRALAFSPSGDFVVGVDRGLRFSTDGGTTWTRRGPGEAFNAIAYLSPTHIVAGSARPDVGVYSSFDGGITWSHVSTPGGTFFWMTTVPTRPGRLLARAALNETGGVYASDNGGATWRVTLLRGVSEVAVTDTTVFAARVGYRGDLSTAGLFSSQDGGSSWRLAAFGGSPVSRVVAVEGGPILVVSGEAVYVSEDLAVWNEVYRSDSEVVAFAGAADASGRVHFTTPDGILSSAPPYSSWSLNTTGQSPLPDVRGVATLGSDAFAVVDRGLYRRASDSWTTLPGLAPKVVNVVAGQDGALYAGTVNGIYRSTDRGTNWTQAGLEGDSVAVVGVTRDGVAFTRGFADGYTTFLRSQDDDQVQERVEAFGDDLYQFSVTSTQGGDLYACARSSTQTGIWTSSDEGASWTQVGAPFYCYGVAIEGNGDAIITTRLQAAEPVESIVRSDDGGRTWTLLLDGATLTGASESGVLLGVSGESHRDYAIVWSTDDGATWRQTLRPGPTLKYGFPGFSLDPDGRMYVASRWGLMSGSLPLGAVRTEERPSSAIPRLSAPYPNPARDRVRLSVGIERPAHVEVGVYDALGRQIATVADTRLSEGTHSFEFDTSALPPGTYVYRLLSDEFSIARLSAVAR